MRSHAARCLAASFFAVALGVGCTPPIDSGPLRISIPKGWSVQKATESSLHLVDVADEGNQNPREPSVILDIFSESTQTSTSYKELIESSGASPEVERIKVDGREATKFVFAESNFGGARLAIIVEDYRVLIVYRPSAPNDTESFDAKLAAAEGAIKSISWTEKPSRASRADPD